MPKEYGSIFVRIIKEDSLEILEEVVDFKYVHSESAKDESRIIIESEKIDLADDPGLQEGKRLRLIWGYLDQFVSQARLMWIWDIKATFGPKGLRLELILYIKINKGL